MERRRNRKWLWWGLGLLVLVAIVGCVVFVVNRNSNNNTQQNDSEVTEKIERQDGEETESTELADAAVAEEKKVKQYEGDDPNEAEELSGVITYAGVAGDKLMIRTSIDQYLTEGSCELTLERGGASIYSSIANIVGDVSTAVCDGFDVATAELGEGEIQINIKLSAEGKSGMIRGKVDI